MNIFSKLVGSVGIYLATNLLHGPAAVIVLVIVLTAVAVVVVLTVIAAFSSKVNARVAELLYAWRGERPRGP